jgi:imidazolonepropionase-like amidohydrolase
MIMPRRFSSALPLFVVAGGLYAQSPQPVTAFVDVNVIPMDRERVLPRQTVLVREGRIVEVGSAGRVRVPAGATRINARDKYLMPGLAEMHAHMPGPQAGDTLIDRVFFLYVANGVTVIRGMLGNPLHLELRSQTASGQRLGPTIYAAGPALGGNQARTVDDGRRMVEEQRAAGYDHVKIQEGLARDVYDTIVATANRVGIRFAGHVPDPVGLARALEAKQVTIDHLDNYLVDFPADTVAAIDRLVAATKAAGTAMVPTMALWEVFLTGSTDTLVTRAELQYATAQWRTSWTQAVNNMRTQNPDTDAGRRTAALRLRLLKALSDAGVPILLGTDSPQLFSMPGFSIHREMAAMARAGLTPYAILRAGTANVAEFYGQSEEFGTVAVGRRADLILLDANPLQNVANVARTAGVMVRGRWVPASEIASRLAALVVPNTGGN